MRPRVILLALAVALPVAAGCGDGGDDGSEKPTTGTDTGTVQSGGGGGSTAGAPDACSLLEDGEVSASVGGAAKPDERTGQTIDGFDLSQCEWKGADGTVTVAVVGTPKRFEQHRERGLGEPVDGLGDGGLVERGTSLETRGSTSGRTVFVLDGDRTLVVALNRGRADVPPDDVVELARAAHGRLP
jgi:hypothetical protein